MVRARLRFTSNRKAVASGSLIGLTSTASQVESELSAEGSMLNPLRHKLNCLTRCSDR